MSGSLFAAARDLLLAFHRAEQNLRVAAAGGRHRLRYRIHRQAGGPLAGFGSAHAVSQDVQSQLRLHQTIVLVVGPNTTFIR
jgi:hypothetical protein